MSVETLNNLRDHYHYHSNRLLPVPLHEILGEVMSSLMATGTLTGSCVLPKMSENPNFMQAAM